MPDADELELPPGFACPSPVDSALAQLETWVNESEDRLRRIHAPIEEVIRSVTSNLDDLQCDDDRFPGSETLLDESTPYLEDLVGMAFTVAQTHLKAIETQSRLIFAQSNRPLSKNVGDPRFFLDRGCRLPNGISRIRFADSVSNFWKHRDQWDTDDWLWLETPAFSVKKPKDIHWTAHYLRGTGIAAGTGGQILRLATFFGITDFADLSLLRTSVRTWGADLFLDIEREIKQV